MIAPPIATSSASGSARRCEKALNPLPGCSRYKRGSANKDWISVMVISAVDVIPDETSPPTKEVIEMQRKLQLEALTEIRRVLLQSPSAENQ